MSFRIETRPLDSTDASAWTADGIGDQNEFASEQEAEATITDLRAMAVRDPSWDAQYRVVRNNAEQDRMSAQINLPVLPGWAELSDSERYHAGRLGRMLSDSGMVSEWRPGCANQVHFSARAFAQCKRTRTLECYAQDSLLCALTHQETLVVLRSLLQAAGYIEALRELKVATAYLRDAYVTAQHRLEHMIEQGEGN